MTLFGKSYTASRGIPFAISELYAIESLLWFNNQYLYDDWRPKIDFFTFLKIFVVLIWQTGNTFDVEIPIMIWALLSFIVLKLSSFGQSGL